MVPLADWAAGNGIRQVMTLVSDYAPGIDIETAFKQHFEAIGGKVVASCVSCSSIRTLPRTSSASPMRRRTQCSSLSRLEQVRRSCGSLSNGASARRASGSSAGNRNAPLIDW
jgi:hypothetical protein